MATISSFGFNATQRANSVDNPNSVLNPDNYKRHLERLLANPRLPSQVRSVVASLSEQINADDPQGPNDPTPPTDAYGPLTLVNVGTSASPDGTAWLAGPASPIIVPVTDQNGDPVILDDGRPLYTALDNPNPPVVTS